MVAAAIGAAAVGAGATIISGSQAADAQENAAAQAAQASRDQIAEARRQYDTTRADYQPYMQTGYGALGKLAGMYGVQRTDSNGNPVASGGAASNGYNQSDFQTSPGYQFRLDEGLKAVQRSAAARGLLASGGTVKAVNRYAQGVASDEYNNYANRLATLAGVGQASTGSVANAGQSMVNSAGQATSGLANAYLNAGNAQASSYANTGSAINGGVNNLASAYLYGGLFGKGGAGASGASALISPSALASQTSAALDSLSFPAVWG